MDQGVQETQTGRAEGHAAESGDHPSARRRPAGRKPGPTPDYEDFGGQREAVIRHCFPELNHWLDNLPDARCQEMCVYLGRHIWWQMILTGLAERIHAEFPKLPICLLFDGLYPVQCVFDLCAKYEWKFIATLREAWSFPETPPFARLAAGMHLRWTRALLSCMLRLPKGVLGNDGNARTGRGDGLGAGGYQAI